jgi:hypothetical protein
MKIDVHAHLFSPAYIQGLQRIFGKDSTPTGQDAQRLIRWMSSDPRMIDVEGRLEEMNKWDISMQILSVPTHGALVQDKGQRPSSWHNWPTTWLFRQPRATRTGSGYSWRCRYNFQNWRLRSWTALPTGRRWWAWSW